QANQVVAAVSRRAEHDPIARLAQHLDGANQIARRKGRAVAIHQQHAVVPRSQQVSRGTKQRTAKFLGHLQHQTEPRWEQIAQLSFGSGRRVDPVTLAAKFDWHGLNGGSDITQKARRQLRSRSHPDMRRKPRLGAPGPGRLAHDADGRRCPRHSESREDSRRAASAIRFSASLLPSASPFSKSPSALPNWLVTWAKQSTGRLRTWANA